ncbi:MAG: SGNH/GDSL hydrolase family protein [Duncaniella sp.]|nr:SGNH/GDSL hydrolase family protein [Duncaniella sp.]
MHRFLKNILRFSCIIIVLLGLTEAAMRMLPSAYADKDRNLRARSAEIATLILGSSHTYYGLNPKEMGDSVFNLANVSQSPEYDLALLLHYDSLMPNLRRIIVPISYFTYRDPSLEEGPEWQRAIPYKAEMHLPLHHDLSIYNLELADFERVRGRLSNLVLRKLSNTCDSLGMGLGFDLAHRDIRWQEGGQARAAKHSPEAPEGRYDAVTATLRQLIGHARTRGCEVVLITTPTWPTYHCNLNAYQEAEMRQGIADLLSDDPVRYYDFMRDTRFTDEDFYDTDHLSDIGARKLSRILADTLGI